MEKTVFDRVREIAELQGRTMMDVAETLSNKQVPASDYLARLETGILPICEINAIARLLNVQAAEFFPHDYSLVQHVPLKERKPAWFVVMPTGEVVLTSEADTDNNAVRKYMEALPNHNWPNLQKAGYRTEYLQVTFTNEDVRS